MSRVTHIEQVFTSRAQAEAWMKHLKATAWPYVWCFENPCGNRWTVAAIVERGGTRKVA